MGIDLTSHWAGLLSLVIFVAAYVLVIFEETTELRKSKPVIIAAGLIWVLVALGFASVGHAELPAELAKHVIEEYGELFLFLIVAMTYVNSMEERRVFGALRVGLIGMGLSYRQLFWITGILSFCLSPFLDNLTTALVMGAVVVALGKSSSRFVTLSCINVVVAANAGGAFSPFGDITTLMVWQKGKVDFGEFFALLVPSVVNYLLPAVLMYFAIPRDRPEAKEQIVRMKPGARVVIALFAATIATAVSFRNFLSLPPALGMMLGFGYLHAWGYFLKITGRKRNDDDVVFSAFTQMQRVEWDTLLFFYGIFFAVGGLGALGYLALTAQYLYVGLGPTEANTIIGVLSAIVDNIPLMFAVLTMNPDMSHGQWLLITLACGVGGSMLAIGSAAGVALMGQAKGIYTFSRHLKWSWAIALGYIASIVTHMAMNGL